MANKIDNEQAATRLARAIASDLALYNEQKIKEGLENDNLFEVMKDDIEEGRELFKSRVSEEIFNNTNIYNQAIIDVMIKPKAYIKCKCW